MGRFSLKVFKRFGGFQQVFIIFALIIETDIDVIWEIKN